MRTLHTVKPPGARTATVCLRAWRLGLALALLGALVGPLLVPERAVHADAPDVLADQATLEVRQPEVQWWLMAGGTDWLTAAGGETVHAGDWVRTGVDAGANLVYFEGTRIEVGPYTALRVDRLETSSSGGIVSRVWQEVGTTVSRVVHLVDPAASFEIETPAAVVFVRGTIPRVAVDPGGVTHVRNVPEPDGTISRVGVIGKDVAQTTVILMPDEETDVEPGRPPAPPRPSTPPTGGATTLPPGPTPTPAPVVIANPCQQPGVMCSPFPTIDPCRAQPGRCAPGGRGTIVPAPTATRRPLPPTPAPTVSTNPCQRPGVVCDPPPPTPVPTVSTNPCERPGIVCDPLPQPTTTNPCQRAGVVCDPLPSPVDPCRLRASLCGPSAPPTAMPLPTRVPPPPIGETGGSHPPILTAPLPIGDTGGGHLPPILETTGGRQSLPIGEVGGVTSGGNHQPPPTAGPVLR
ncbi:MAG TPA: FecR family protein [Chloroflexota bacterium]|jgi:hypothetical protein